MRTRGGAALLALAASCALAQERDAVVVTATRVEQPSLQVPASIDRVQAEDIRSMRPQVNLSESLGRVPGITVQNRNNYAQDLQVQSRGFGARSTFGIRGIRLIADGIPQSQPDGQGQVSSFDLGSAERIEVLRGPFAPMYGNAAGGVISIVTEPGSREPGIGADVSFGSYDTWRAAMRASGVSGRTDGIVDLSRFETGGYRDHSSARRDLANAKLGIDLGGGTGLTLVANYLDLPEAQDPGGLTRAQMDANPRQVVSQVLTFDSRKTVRQNQGGATLSHRFGANTVAVSAYVADRSVRQYLAFSGAPPPATTSGGVVDLNTTYTGGSLRFTNESDLAGRKIITTVGGEYERMDQARKGYVNNNGTLGALRRDEDDVATTSGLFAQADWRFAERWSALVGVRATRVEFDSTDLFIVPGNPDDSGKISYDATTPSVGLLFRLSPTSSLYASYGRGFETPTFAELAHQNTGSGLNFGLQASKSTHYEVGAKTLLGAARLNAALFTVETDDEIVVDQSSNGRTTFKNAGRTRRTGAELYADATLPAGFEGTLAWTLLDATFIDSYVSGGQTVAAGNRLPAVPDNYFYGELRWRYAPIGFGATLEVLYKSDVAVNDVNTAFADAYTVANLAFGFTQRGGKWRVTEYLRVDNLTDKKYAGSVIVNETNGRYYEPSPQRNMTVGVQAKLQF
ncbi:MAG TPA: TonB-dependent receptor [Burkholderiales bacterium]